MPGEFVPFFASLSKPASAGAPDQAGFKPLPATLPASPVPTAGSESSAQPAPTITVKRDGDRITLIQVRCSCGQLIELDCSY